MVLLLSKEALWGNVFRDTLSQQLKNQEAVASLCRFLETLCEMATLHADAKSAVKCLIDIPELMSKVLQRHKNEREITMSLCNIFKALFKCKLLSITSPVDLAAAKQLLSILTLQHEKDSQTRDTLETLIHPSRVHELRLTDTSYVAQEELFLSHFDAKMVIPSQDIKVTSRMDVDLFKGNWKQTPVVLKVKQSVAESKTSCRQGWLQELQTLSKLRHPRIVTLLGFCLNVAPSVLDSASHGATILELATINSTADTMSALVLEYMEKGDLRSLLATDHARMPLIEKLHIALDVSEGIRFLHESDVFHRDLKSVYVLIDRHGRAKLTGFGGGDNGWTDSKSGSKGHHRNDVSVAFSSLSIMDRKVDSNQKELLKHADMYAFGVIVWELITGKVPWAAASAGKKSKKGKLTLTEEEERHCPKALSGLMNRCFESTSIDSNMSSAANGSNKTKNKTKEKANKDIAICKLQGFGEICEALNLIVQEEQQRLRDREKLIPDGFICPITQDVMRDPVMLMDGHSYERKAIVDWLKRCNRSPLTNEELPRGGRHGETPLILDNYALKTVIERFGTTIIKK
jgi:serine/threonine protein kinase